MKKLCIYHGNCADGFAAALAVKMAHNCEVMNHPLSWEDVQKYADTETLYKL